MATKITPKKSRKALIAKAAAARTFTDYHKATGGSRSDFAADEAKVKALLDGYGIAVSSKPN